MKLKRWHAIPIAMMLLAVALLTGAAFFPEARRPPGPRTTLEGIEACATGSLSLARFDCPSTSCDDTDSESVFLRWTEREVTVRYDSNALRAENSKLELSEYIEQTERVISRELLPLLLADFASLPRRPDDPPWPTSVRLRDSLEVFGQCDDDYVAADLRGHRLVLVDSLRAAPLSEAPQILSLWRRGPGPRADRLFKRIEKLARP